MFRFRLTPSLVIASLALLVALGGTGFAAVSKLGPKNSVSSPQVVDGSLLAKDFNAADLPAALGYASINRDGTADTLRSKNVRVLPTKDTPDTKNGGYVCLNVTSPHDPHVAAVTLDLSGSAGYTAVVDFEAIDSWCPGGADAVVLTSNDSGPRGKGFYIVFY